MANEFRIRKKITERIEGSGKTRFGAGGSDRNLRFDNGEELESVDSLPTDKDRYDEYNDENNGNSGNVERPLANAGGTIGEADLSCGIDRTNADRISGNARTTDGGNPDGDLDLNGELPITGWEYERGILEGALLSQGTDEQSLEKADSDFTYHDNSVSHLGTDSAYLAVNLIGTFDNDRPIEDCTTKRKPKKERKNIKPRGSIMGGL